MDFGFGAPGAPGGAGGAPGGVRGEAPGRPDFGAKGRSSGGGRRPQPPPAATPRKRGMDIRVEVDVPSGIARDGGSVSVTYHRRAPGAERVREDIATLRVPPGSTHGQHLRVPKMGHAGNGGGVPGDLICVIAVRRDPAAEGAGAGEGGTRSDPATLKVSVPEALLGGRVVVETPGGRLAITLRPCTPGGLVLRLAGRGAGGGDHFVRVHVIPPDTLDEESRRLIEAFADRNPDSPRS